MNVEQSKPDDRVASEMTEKIDTRRKGDMVIAPRWRRRMVEG